MTQPQQFSTPELDERREQQMDEYGTYVATTDIYVGTALAYRQGDPVPVSNVENHGYLKDELVERVKQQRASSTSSSAAGTKTAGGTTTSAKKEGN